MAPQDTPPAQQGQAAESKDAQEDEIAAYRSHVQWSSSYARMCEEKLRQVDPTAEISNLMQRKERRMRSCSPSRQVLRVDKNPPHVISMIARHRQQVADLVDTSNKLERRAEAAERKASEWQQASSDVRKLLEKRDKENAVLHIRCTKLQELVTASDEQIMRQADTIRRLEYCVDPDATANAHLQLAQAQRSIQDLQQAVAVRDAELMQVQALASTLTAAASPAEGLEAARVATAQLMEAVRGASSTSDAVPEVAPSRTAADSQQSQAHASIGDCCAAQDAKSRGDVRSGEFPTVAPGAALESFQRLLEEFADALTTTKREQQRTAAAVHTGVQTIGARGKVSVERQGSGDSKDGSRSNKGETQHHEKACEPSNTGTQSNVQELELRLQQALQERDALLDHVLEQRGSGMSSKQCPAAPSKQSSAKSEGRSEVQGDGAMHSDNSFQKRDRPPPKSTGQHSFQSGTVASRSKSVSQKRRSLSVESSRSVQSARGSRPSTGGRAQTSSRPHTSRGASLTRANRGSGFGSVQGQTDADPAPRSEKVPSSRGLDSGTEGRAAKVAALGERQVERRREKSLMHALSLLRNIKSVIQGLPEDRAPLTPAASNSGSGNTPISTVLSGIDVAYEEAFSAAQALRARMDEALHAATSIPSQPSFSAPLRSLAHNADPSPVQQDASDEGIVARSIVGFGSVFTQVQQKHDERRDQEQADGSKRIEVLDGGKRSSASASGSTGPGSCDVPGHLQYEELRGEVLNAMRAACSSGLEIEDSGELGKVLHSHPSQVSDACLITTTGKVLRSAVSAQQEVKRLRLSQRDLHSSTSRASKDSIASGALQREPSLNSQCSTLKALNTLLQQQLDGAREDLAQACAQVKVLQTHRSEAQRPQAPEQGAVAMLYGQLEKARAAQEALEKENEKIWAEVQAAIGDKASLEEELEELRAELQLTSSDRGAAEQERANLQETLRRSLAGTQTLQDEVESVTQENQRLRGEVSALTRVLEATVLQQEATASHRSKPGTEKPEQCDPLRSEELQQQAGGLRMENGALNAEVDGLKDENSSLRLELLALRERVEDRAKHRNSETLHAEEPRKYQERLDELQLELTGQEEAAGMLWAENDGLKREVLELQSRAAAASTLLEENGILKRELESLKEENHGLQMAVEQAKDALLALQSEVNELRSGLHSMTHSEAQSAPDSQRGETTTDATFTDAKGNDTCPGNKQHASKNLQSTLESSWRLSAVTGDTVRGPSGEDLGRPEASRSPGFLEDAGMGIAADSKHSESALKLDALVSPEMHGGLAFAPQQHIVMNAAVVQPPLPIVTGPSHALPQGTDVSDSVSGPSVANETHHNTHDVTGVPACGLQEERQDNSQSRTDEDTLRSGSTETAGVQPSSRGAVEGEGAAARSMIPRPNASNRNLQRDTSGSRKSSLPEQRTGTQAEAGCSHSTAPTQSASLPANEQALTTATSDVQEVGTEPCTLGAVPNQVAATPVKDIRCKIETQRSGDMRATPPRGKWPTPDPGSAADASAAFGRSGSLSTPPSPSPKKLTSFNSLNTASSSKNEEGFCATGHPSSDASDVDGITALPPGGRIAKGPKLKDRLTDARQAYALTRKQSGT